MYVEEKGHLSVTVIQVKDVDPEIYPNRDSLYIKLHLHPSLGLSKAKVIYFYLLSFFTLLRC